MTEEDRRLAAVVAAFAGPRADALAAVLGGASAPEVRGHVERLARWSRDARIAELTRALAPSGARADPADRAASSRGSEAPPPLARIRRRLARELDLELDRRR